MAKLTRTGAEDNLANGEQMSTCKLMESDANAAFMALKLSRADDWVWM